MRVRVRVQCARLCVFIDDHHRSIYTIMVYLNESPDFSGGETVLYSGDRAAIDASHVMKPVQGTCVVFTHDLIHEGRPVEAVQGEVAGAAAGSGGGRSEPFKYIVRSDLMFR